MQRADGAPLRAALEQGGGPFLRADAPLPDLLQGLAALREALLAHLEAARLDPHAASRAGRRLTQAVDLLLIEAAAAWQRRVTPPVPPGSSEQVEAALAGEVRRAGRYGHSLGLLLVEVDRYGEYGGRYGPALAELAMREIESILERVTREVDLKHVLEGGRIAVILPESSVEDARWVGERIREAVAGAGVMDEGHLVITGLTVTVAVAAYPLHGEAAPALLQAADGALRRARLVGGDMVVTAGDFPLPS